MNHGTTRRAEDKLAWSSRAALVSASRAKAQAAAARAGSALALVGLLALGGGGPGWAAPEASPQLPSAPPPLPPERAGRASALPEPPLPPERAVEGAAPAAVAPPAVAAPPALAPTGPGPVAAAPATEPDCVAGLADSGIVVEAAAQPTPAMPACQIDRPVRLMSVADPGEGGRAVMLPAGPVIACRLVRPLGEWLSGVAFPVLRAAHGAPVRTVQTGPGSECRSRDHIPGERMSAHAIGLALDIAGFTFADGKTLAVRPDGAPAADAAALAAARKAACGWFTTILGPGSDPYHTDHLHLDIQQHGSSERYRICQ